MDMVRHNDKLVKEVGFPSIVVKGVDEKSCPTVAAEKRASAPGLSSDHVGLASVSRMFSLGSQPYDLRAKALSLFGRTARLKARPFKTIAHRLLSSEFLHHLYEILEQVVRVVRTWRGFGVVLDTEQRQVSMAHAFEGVVVQVHVRQFYFALR